MLSEEGYTVKKLAADEDGQETELVFTKKAYERKFFSDETNLSFIHCFLDHAKCDPLTGEIGKTIFFAVSRKHATKLVTLLNEEVNAPLARCLRRRVNVCGASYVRNSRCPTDDDRFRQQQSQRQIAMAGE